MGREARGPRAPDRWDALATTLVAAFAAWVTWPSAVHPASTVAAPIGYDVSSSIAKFAAIAREGTTPFSGDRLTSVAWPDGAAATPGLDAAQILYSGPMWLASVAFGAIAAHALLSVLGIVLTGLVTHLFVRRLTGDPRAGVVAGIAFAAFPHLVLTLRAAPAYAHMWLYVLPLWAAVELLAAPGRRRALLAGASVLPAMFWTPYFTLHVLVEALGLGAVAGVILARRFGSGVAVRRVAQMAVLPAAGLAAYIGVGVLSGFEDAPERAASDAYQQAAHPLMFAVPGVLSWMWGDGPRELLAEVVPRAAGTNLYLGISVLALAAVGAVTAVRGVARGPVRDGAVLALGAGLLLTLWSLPPTVGLAGVDLSTPSRITAAFVPGLRAGQRFVMPVMCMAVVLAGIGVARILRDRRPAVGLALSGLLTLGVTVDLAVDPANRTVRVPPSPALAELRAAPDGPAIEYQSRDDGTTLLVGAVARPCVLQAQHGKPLLNGCNLLTPPTTPARLVSVDAPGDCAAAERLRVLGVRYVITDAGVPTFASCAGVSPLAEDPGFTVMRLR